MLHVDLNLAGYNTVQKVEGLAVIDPWTLAVINDNDFGVAAITINPDGTFVRNYVPEPVRLGIIDVRQNGFDASNTDGKINIRPWPVKGMFLPDAIASYKVGRETYLVTANEGDAREYIFKDAAGKDVVAFDEQVRVGSSSVVLDPIKFPNAAVLKNNANLGRLRVTTTKGRNPTTGFYEELYSFGARSFSIRDISGKVIFDSGDDLEWITALAYPTNFNSSHDNNIFDDRSDDKGPEPEGVVIGKVFGSTYAFIGLERIGGVVVYDISDPHAPFFVDYVNRRNFGTAVNTPEAGDLGPEGLLFIKAEDSPTCQPLLVIGNEISGTTTVFEINRVRIKKDGDHDHHHDRDDHHDRDEDDDKGRGSNRD
ncbi:MAG: choice-of-anchor I family protein [Opitutaceae bacterium]|nr:choice-of-anchor I family protein [Verrucomicrobiales bacterium]